MNLQSEEKEKENISKKGKEEVININNIFNINNINNIYNINNINNIQNIYNNVPQKGNIKGKDECNNNSENQETLKNDNSVYIHETNENLSEEHDNKKIYFNKSKQIDNNSLANNISFEYNSKDAIFPKKIFNFSSENSSK